MKDEFKLWCMCDNDSEVFEKSKLHHYRYFSAKRFTTNNANTRFYSSFKILKEANKLKRQVLVSSFKDRRRNFRII